MHNLRFSFGAVLARATSDLFAGAAGDLMPVTPAVKADFAENRHASESPTVRDCGIHTESLVGGLMTHLLRAPGPA